MKDNLIITISRAFGIPGRDVGKNLADALGIAYYDNEIMAEMMPEEEKSYYRTAGENTGADTRYTSKVYTQFYQEGGAVEVLSRNMQMFRSQSALMLELAEKGSAVFVGRCADKVLEDFPNLVRVFIGAGEEFRLLRAMELYGVNAKQAKNMMRDVDKARNAYYRFYADREWGLRENYDICLNAEKVSEDGMVAVIRAFIDGLM